MTETSLLLPPSKGLVGRCLSSAEQSCSCCRVEIFHTAGSVSCNVSYIVIKLLRVHERSSPRDDVLRFISMITAFSLLSVSLFSRRREGIRVPGAKLDCESSVWGASGGARGGGMGVTKRDAVGGAVGAWVVSGSVGCVLGVRVRLGFFPSIQ